MNSVVLLFVLSPMLPPAFAQTAIPTFQYAARSSLYTLAGRDPAEGGTTTISTLVVPISLSFEAARTTGEPLRMDATPDVPKLVQSPVFSPFAFPVGGTTQFADAMLRATFPRRADWHTVLAKPEVMNTVGITIPAASGYALTSRQSGSSLAIVDLEYVQRQLFKQVGEQPGKLVIALTRNTAFYAEGDATICCSWGTHGSDSYTGNSFVLASYLDGAPAVVENQDVQPLTEQLAEFIYDPLHDPLVREGAEKTPGNQFPAWMRPASMHPGDQGACGGTRVASAYFLLEPTDTNLKNNLPASKPFVAHAGNTTYHLQNVALLHWYLGDSRDLGNTNSFPEQQALTEPAKPCPAPAKRRQIGNSAPRKPTATAIQRSGTSNGHQLIGYWVGYGAAGATFPLREVAPQWDVVIVAFATPAKNQPEGTLQFQVPAGLDPGQFKAGIADLKNQGKKVMISLGGGGQYFTLADPKNISNFLSSVTAIVKEYGFDGVDIDFESPSLSLDPGDTNFKHPTTPSIVNLIAALRRLRDTFGSGFMISLVPEGTQIPAGYRTYGGQFGSYLPLAYGIRDILSFMDVQDYNTPPLEGLDGRIYQAGSVDYHAAMTELVLQGFNVGGDPHQFFPPMPADKVAIGFLIGETSPSIVSQAMQYAITGAAPSGAKYKMLKSAGYPGMLGAMFWTIDADRLQDYTFSNSIGPQLHRYRPNR